MIDFLIAQLGAAAFYGSIGLLIGWNVLPQPKFVKKGYDWVVAYVKSKRD